MQAGLHCCLLGRQIRLPTWPAFEVSVKAASQEMKPSSLDPEPRPAAPSSMAADAQVRWQSFSEVSCGAPVLIAGRWNGAVTAFLAL